MRDNHNNGDVIKMGSNTTQTGSLNQTGDIVIKKTTRILVIGEDSTTTDLLSMALRPELFKIYSAGSLEEGLRYAKSCKPHLIIFELNPSGEEGRLLYTRFREYFEAPILVLSTYQNPAMVAKVLDGGADGFLTKPVTNEVLVAHINNLTRRARFEREASIDK